MGLAEKDKQIANLEIQISKLESSFKEEKENQAREAVCANESLKEAQDKHQQEKQELQNIITNLEGTVSNASLTANESTMKITALETKISELEGSRKGLEDQISEY